MKWARVFLCLGRQRERKALYLGQTSLHSGRAQSLFYLGFFPLPRGSGVNRCSHTPARRGGPSPASPAPAAAQPLPCFQAAALLNEGPWVPAGAGTTRPLETGARTPSLHIRVPPAAEWEKNRVSSGQHPGGLELRQTAKWRCHPLPISVAECSAGRVPRPGPRCWLDGRGPRLQGAHCGRNSGSAA